MKSFQTPAQARQAMRVGLQVMMMVRGLGPFQNGLSAEHHCGDMSDYSLQLVAVLNAQRLQGTGRHVCASQRVLWYDAGRHVLAEIPLPAGTGGGGLGWPGCSSG